MTALGKPFEKRADGQLLDDDLADDADGGSSYPGLTIDRATEITVGLEQMLSRPSYRWERCVLAMRGWAHRNARFLRPLLSPLGRLYQRCFNRRRRGF